jgi:hypothetical protein
MRMASAFERRLLALLQAMAATWPASTLALQAPAFAVVDDDDDDAAGGGSGGNIDPDDDDSLPDDDDDDDDEDTLWAAAHPVGRGAADAPATSGTPPDVVE